MGEVWKARDTRLDRSVAIKILPAELAPNAQLRLRFEREARTISQLNHPHICSLFDVGENYLVMELVEGESLADRLARGPLPLPEVLKLGAQIAEALDRAHRAGVVHRDLKPGNVMITRGGAKLLDFGLAKSSIPEVSADTATLHKPLTQEGTIVGTLQYMAPEQLDGVEADARTDIFALGTVLYEMTTGKRAFEGKTRTSLMAAIASSEPQPISQLQPLAPPAFEHVVAKCLSKDPDDRWQSAHDIAAELKWIAGAGARTALPVSAPRRNLREWIAWIVAVLAAGAAAWLATRPRPRPQMIEAVIADANDGLDFFSGLPALSPDGKQLAYTSTDASGRRLLWLRSMERGTARAIPGTEQASSPFWSPDGRFIAFSANNDLKRIAAAGGEVEAIGIKAIAGTWNRDDVILHVVPGTASAIWRARASGGEPAEVLTPKSIGAGAVMWPRFLPDGNHFLFLARGGQIETRGQEGTWVAALDGREKPRLVVRGQMNAAYAEPGFLLFVRDGVLRAQRFDLDALRVTGEAMNIAPVQTYEVIAPFAASAGLLVYQPPGTQQRSELVVKNRKGEIVRTPAPPAFYWSPRVSPDGQRIAVDVSNESARGDIWVFGTSEGAGTRFTFDTRNETAPVWSSRGDEIAWSLNDVTDASLMRKRFGESPQTLLKVARSLITPTDWSSDGGHLAVTRFAGNNNDAVVWSIDRRAWIEIAATPANEAFGVFSPDGRWIAYQSDESGRSEIYVQPFPPTGAKYQLSTSGGVTPRWVKNEIWWVDANERLSVAAVETAPAFRAELAETLFPIRQQHQFTTQYDVLPDGTILVNALVRGQAKPMTLVVNWRLRFE